MLTKPTLQATSVYVLRAQLAKGVWRDVAIGGNNTLEDLAMCIITAYDFDMDHAFGFFNKANPWQSTYTYELFQDMENGVDDMFPEVERRGVRKVTVQEAFSQPEFLWPKVFLFDYGDEWLFSLRLMKTYAREDFKLKGKLPLLVAEKGDAPEQYSDYD